MSSGLVLLACGGHGRVVLDAALTAGLKVRGFVDIKAPADNVFGVPFLGGDDILEETDPSTTLLLNGFGFIKGKNLRKVQYDKWSSLGFKFHGILHPSVILGRACSISSDSQLMAGSVLQTNVTVGANTVINTGVTLDHDVSIGDHCFISPGVTVCGGVSVADEVFVGAGAVLLPGTRVEAGTFIRAGSLVQTEN